LTPIDNYVERQQYGWARGQAEQCGKVIRKNPWQNLQSKAAPWTGN
jgi:hypothetical protein